MAEMKCPTCGRTWPDNYCGFCASVIPDSEPELEEVQADAAQGDSESDVSPDGMPVSPDAAAPSESKQWWEQTDDSEESQNVRCTTCGMPGKPGSECPQCGAMLPMAASAPAQTPARDCSAMQAQACAPAQSSTVVPAISLSPEATRREVSAAYLALPNGTRLNLCEGREYTLGRESCDSQIAQALSNSTYVSRRHCSIRVDFARAAVTVRDEGSTNGTFVGNDTQRRKVIGQETYPLPVQIWLGTHVHVSIDI